MNSDKENYRSLNDMNIFSQNGITAKIEIRGREKREHDDL